MAGAKAVEDMDILRQASSATDYDFYEEFQALPIADVLSDIPTSFLQDLLEDDLDGCEPVADTGCRWLAPLELPNVDALAGLESPGAHFGLHLDQQGQAMCPPSLAIRTMGEAAAAEPSQQQQARSAVCLKAASESPAPASPASDASTETPGSTPKGRRSRSVFEAMDVEEHKRKRVKLADSLPKKSGPGRKSGRPSRQPQEYLLSVMLKVAKMASEEREQREALAASASIPPPVHQTN